MENRRMGGRAAVAGVAACAVLVGLSGAAFGQTPLPVTNASFEEREWTPLLFNNIPLGFDNLSGPLSRWRWRAEPGAPSPFNANDTLPGSPPPVRTGFRSVEVGTEGNGGFRGFSTDTLNYFMPMGDPFNPWFPYYDVAIDPNGPDIEVTVWYFIPANAPLNQPNPPLGPDAPRERPLLKANVKLALPNGRPSFQDATTHEVFAPVDAPLGQWNQLRLVISMSEARQMAQEGWNNCLCFPSGNPALENPPYRSLHRLKVTFGRFVGDGTPTSGTVFFDDLQVIQGGLGPQPCNPADIAQTDASPGPDGCVDNGDFGLFIASFFSASCPACGQPGAGVCNEADIAQTDASPGPDGCVDNGDFGLFISSFFGASCPDCGG
jgi:hypothetical protein